MLDSIGTAPPSQLLVLMAFPLVGAVLLVAFIAFSVNQRKKKSQMKLGIPPKPAKAQEIVAPPEKNKADPVVQVNRSPQPAPPKKQQALSAVDDDLNLGILSNSLNRESIMETHSPAADENKIDLATRLGNHLSPSSQPAQSKEPIELLRLLRDPHSGQLIMEIAGKRYTKLVDIVDKEIGQYVLKLAAHLLAFTNGVFLTEAGMKSVAAPKVGKAPQPIKGAASVPQASTTTVSPEAASANIIAEPPAVPKPSEAGSGLLTPPPVSPPIHPEPKPQRGGLFGLGGVSQGPPASLPTLNLAEEINDIVQARLRYSPLADSHQISISSDLSGGIRIRVDGQYYASPEDIPDDAIRDLIKASIKEWERS